MAVIGDYEKAVSLKISLSANTLTGLCDKGFSLPTRSQSVFLKSLANQSIFALSASVVAATSHLCDNN